MNIYWILFTQEFEIESSTFKFNRKKNKVCLTWKTNVISPTAAHTPLFPANKLSIDSLFSLTVACGLPPSEQLLKSFHLIASIQLRISEGMHGILSMAASEQQNTFTAKIYSFDTSY